MTKVSIPPPPEGWSGEVHVVVIPDGTMHLIPSPAPRLHATAGRCWCRPSTEGACVYHRRER